MLSRFGKTGASLILIYVLPGQILIYKRCENLGTSNHIKMTSGLQIKWNKKRPMTFCYCAYDFKDPRTRQQGKSDSCYFCLTSPKGNSYSDSLRIAILNNDRLNYI